jgi:ABC-type sugar transport system ATPase subunit
MASIELRNITKMFKSKIALNDICLNVSNGESVVIFGPSGAGKTTLLNTVSGIYLPEKGEVLLDGKNVTQHDISNRNIAMVFESYALYPHMSVFSNMAFPLKSPRLKWKSDKIEAAVKNTAKILQIDELLDRKPSQLSNGQKQRVSIGRALVRNPAALLMDEPLAHLDAKLRNEMRSEFKEMQNRLSVTIVYATPDYREALALGNRIAVLNAGVIEQVDAPQVVLNSPANTFVARLFGDPRINLVNVDYLHEAGRGYFVMTDADGSKLKVHNTFERIAAECKTNKFILGIKPSNVKISNDSSDGNTVNGFVYGFERRGIKNVATIKAGMAFLEAVLPQTMELKIDDAVGVSLNLDRCLLFDSQRKTLLYAFSDL